MAQQLPSRSAIRDGTLGPGLEPRRTFAAMPRPLSPGFVSGRQAWVDRTFDRFRLVGTRAKLTSRQEKAIDGTGVLEDGAIL